ncbi:MAG: serine/threonine protein kinase [Vicinamibacteria bacterium]|nr:serine/threonine protein kinase [Vicinamibacteria bacterium]
MSTPPPPLPAEIAGRYQVESRLGAGAFGTVYKAKDKLLGRRVAIKTIRLDGLVATQTALEELVERFQREARVSAQLRHPGIVTIYDVGEADGANYLAMEFIEGSGLDRIIAGERRVAPGRAAAICAQVAEALHYAHEQGVVHRDIKPANIMIEAGDRVKVADFGIAKVKDAGEQQLTATGSLLGTPSYMSPEQARGQQLDGRSDLFSLGCVLYEMLKGRKAFQGDSITALLFKIIAEEPPPLRDDDPEIPDELEAIVRKALAKSPADRYANGQEMSDALRAVASAGSLPTLKAAAPGATPATRVLPATAPGASTAVTEAPTAQTDAPTVVGAAPTLGRPVASPPPPPPAAVRRPAPPAVPPPPPRAAAAPARVPALALGLLAVGALGLLVIAAGGAWWFLGRGPQPVATATATPDPAPVVTPPPSAPAQDAGAPEATPVPNSAEEREPEPAPEPAPTASAATRTADARTAGREGGAGRAMTAPPVPAPTPAAAGETTRPGFEHLDDEVDGGEPDGGEAGRRVAEAFRSGGGSSAPSGRFAPRARSPQGLRLPERPAVATLRHLIDAQDTYARREGRYGSLSELASAGVLRLDVPLRGDGFQRRGYRFELQLGDEEFRVSARPLLPGLRSFQGDESGRIQ